MSHTLSNAIRMVNRRLAAGGSALLCSSMLLAGAAEAQMEEELVVTGIRGSLKAAIDTKRDAVTVVDGINAEDIGKFPDRNAAESLSRIPGVSISREFGEGEQVNIRGTSSAQNRTLLNGQTVATADWFILDNPSRSFNYTLLPSVLINNVEVYKTPDAKMDEGSLGGTVVIRTRKPLELDANTVSLAVEGQYQEKSGETDPQLSAQYSWKNDDATFGVLVSGTQQKRSVVREGFEVLGWAEMEDGTFAPSQAMGAPRFEQERERTTLFASAQFAPTDELEFTLNMMDSEMDSDNMNANWLVWPNVDEGTGVYAGDALVGGSSEDSRVAVNWINRVSSTKTNSYTLEGGYTSDVFVLTGAVGTTKAEGGTYRETSWEYNGLRADGEPTETAWDLRTPFAEANPAPNSASEFAAGWIWGGEKPTTDEETYAQIDLEIPLDGVFTAFKAGAKLRDAERTQNRIVYSWHGPETVPEGTPGGSYLGYIFDQCPTLADCGLDDLGTMTIDAPVEGNLTNVIAQNRDVMEQIAFGGLNGVDADYAKSEELANIWSVKEQITALYVQGDFATDVMRGNIGLRYVSTAQTSGGYDFSGDSWGFRTIDRDWLQPAYIEWVEVENDYTEILPSANFAFDLDDDMVLRVSAAKVMARQNWSDLSPFETYGALNVPNPTGQAGNPMLDPTLATQLDLSYEWYFADASIFSAAYFFKDIDSYLSQDTYVDSRYDQSNDVWVDVTFTQPVNGAGGKVQGIELNVQHAWDNGFGLTANYTYTDSNEDDSSREGYTPGVSKNMYNLSGFFENDTISARLLYNYRSSWYKGAHFNGNDLFNESFGQFDATFAFHITDDLSVNLEAINLADEEVVEYANNDTNQLMSIYENGRRYTVGLRYTF